MPLELCVDASVAVKWVIEREVYRQKALKLLRESRSVGITLMAPPLFEMEVDSIIQTRLVEGRISTQAANRSLAQLDTAPVVITPHVQLRQRAREIARTFRQRKVYDATYAALADLRGYEFWTADRAFYNRVKSGLSFVRYLPDYP